MKYFFVNYFFLYKLKTSLEACFLWHNSYIWTDRLNKQKQPFGQENSWSPSPLSKWDPNKTTCFHENIAKILRTAFFIKYLLWLLLNKVKTNLKTTWFILLPDWLYHVVKSVMTFNSKDSAKLQRYRSKNTEKQKHEKLKHRKTKT